jgi:hypothetical protein
LLHRLAPSGKRILVLERGRFLPREKDNWNYHGSFKYYSPEVMFNKEAVRSAGFQLFRGRQYEGLWRSLFRLREKDFESSAIVTEFPPSGRSSIAIGKILHAGRGTLRSSRQGRRRPDRTLAFEGISTSPISHEAAHQRGF